MTMLFFSRFVPKRSSSTVDYGASGISPTAVARPRSRTSRARPANLLTMVTAIRPGCQGIIRQFFSAVRHVRLIEQPLIDMAFIRAAHWTIIETLPDGQGEAEPLRPAHLLFESTYDVELSEYIDLFARRLPWQMRGVWGTSYGYPGVMPSSAFTRWVNEHDFPLDYRFRAYPEATTRMVRSGLRVAERLRSFDAAVARCSDEDFAFEFRRLLIELQEDLS